MRGMGTTDNINTIKTIYEAFGRGDVDAILANVTDDVDWSNEAANSELAPWYGPRKGKDEVARYWRFRDGKVEYYRGAEDTALMAATLQS
jgi:SnoaL-like domain